MRTNYIKFVLPFFVASLFMLVVTNLYAVDFTVEAESFVADGGGYNDGNGGGVLKGPTAISYVNAGDWVEYTISVPNDGMYEMTYRAATPSSNAEVTCLLDGYSVSVDAVPGTGSWSTWGTFNANNLASLTAGSHTLRLEASGADPWQWNLDKIDFTKTGELVTVDVIGIEILTADLNFSEEQYATIATLISPTSATDKTINWSSGNSLVASVDAKGVVTGKAEGTTMITATTNDGSFKDSIEVKVFPASSVLTIEAEDFSSTGGVTYTEDLGVRVNTGTGINWVNSTDWAEYSLVIPDDGRYQVTYYISTPSDNAEITSYVNGSEVSVDFVQESQGWDNYYPLIASKEALLPAGSHTFKIEGSGSNAWQWNLDKIEFIKLSGDLTFPVTGVELDTDSYTLLLTESIQLTETILPSYATDKTVSWSSDSPGIASVVDGLVTGESKGAATITVKTNDGDFIASANITVAGAKVDVTPQTVTIEKEQTTTLQGQISPVSAVDEIVWSSADDNIATVSSAGVVTGVAEGKVKIIATLKNEQVYDECEVTVTHIKAKFTFALDSEAKYRNTVYYSGGTMEVTSIYTAGEGKTINTSLNGIRYMLRQVNTSNWAVVKEYKFEDASVIGKESGTSVGNISLAGATPTASLPSGNAYLLFVRVMNSDLEIKEISVMPITIAAPIVSAKEDEFAGVTVFPNPATNLITLQGVESDECTVSIYNINGVEVKSQVIAMYDEKIIQVDDIPVGYYLIKVSSGDSFKIIRFSKVE